MAYHIEEKRLRFCGLPFCSEDCDLIYMDGTGNATADKCVRNSIGYIRRKVANGWEGHGRFIYLPAIYDDIAEAAAYNAPYSQGGIKGLGNDTLLRYLDDDGTSVMPGPCLLHYEYDDFEGRDIFSGYSFTIDSEDDFAPMLDELLDRMGLLSTPEDDDGIRYCRTGPIIFDESEEEETQRLMDEIKEKVERLRQRGVSEWALSRLIKPERRLSRLVVTPDMTLLLPDYGDMKIHLEPLHTAVYLLFLRHPEGIAFKDLSDYHAELTRIYISVRQKRGEPVNLFSYKWRRSIDNIASPLSNSINEKCSRIRAAFLLEFADYLACDYYITGERGMPKRIKLARELVEWQTEI